jgi:hypothetical protein
MATSIVTHSYLSGPVFHEAVLRERVAAMQGEVCREIGEAIQSSSEELTARLRHMLVDATRRAYADGIRDGFAQGVAAEAALRAERPPC